MIEFNDLNFDKLIAESRQRRKWITPLKDKPKKTIQEVELKIISTKKNGQPRRKWVVPEHWSKQMKAKYINYSNRIETKGKEFDLTPNQFESYFTGNCIYCGTDSELTIDRIDSKIRYTPTNCQSCCRDCNVLKSFMPEELFLSQIVKIVKWRHLE